MAETTHQGVIVEWAPKRSFGYAESGGERVFLHISEFVERFKWPEENDRVKFRIGEGPNGRPCAHQIVLLSLGSILTWRHFMVVALLLILPAVAIPSLSEWLSPWWIGFCMAICSALAGLNLWFDKRFAMTAHSRVPEATLHLFELMGGWPGSFLAQRLFRHKISKTGYQVIYWLIVLIYQLLALDIIFGGFFINGLEQLGAGA